ncbi:MAG: molybdopterin-dependent oxidoreductase, partial [Maioricimonas sp. JB049]
MTDLSISRRDILKSGSVAAGLGWLGFLDPSFAFPAQAAEEELVPFLNMPRSRPGILDWETLDSWLTPDDQVFSVSHYDKPQIDPEEYQLEITGLVERPKTFTLEEIRALPQVDQLMTLECAGNGVSKGFMGAIYNSRWTGTPLAPLLEECGLKEDALEVVFIGTDRSEETLRKGTKRETTFEVPFGRSLSVEDAMQPELLLAYERNGEPLRQENGA